MRLAPLLILFLAITAISHAQGQSPATRQNDVAVINCSWARERVPGWDKQPSSAEPFDVTMERIANEQRLQQARNARNPGATTRGENEAKLIEKATLSRKDSKGERPRFGYRYKVRVRNDGAKTIKSIDWDYVFIDKETREEISRRQLTSDEKIQPGKEKELSVFILSPPSKTMKLDKSLKGEAPFVERIELFRISYSDGSVWQKP